MSHGPVSDEPALQAEPDQVAADIGKLREKLGVEADEGEGLGMAGPRAVEAHPDDAIVTVQLKATGDPFDHGARPKAVLVSGKERRIVAAQG